MLHSHLLIGLSPPPATRDSPSRVPPRSVVDAGIAITPIEIGHQIVPTIDGTGKIIEAWPGPMDFLEYHWYPGEEASLWVTELGQARKEGIVVADIVPPQLVSTLV